MVFVERSAQSTLIVEDDAKIWRMMAEDMNLASGEHEFTGNTESTHDVAQHLDMLIA